MKPRARPVAGITASAGDADDDALTDFCVLLVEAVQVPEVAAALAEALGVRGDTAGRWPAASPTPPSGVRHSPPARGIRNRR